VDSTDQNPTWTYSTVGTYTVKLTVNGLVVQMMRFKTDYITVNDPVPVAGFVGVSTSGTSHYGGFL
jgi:PKD repeat protein